MAHGVRDVVRVDVLARARPVPLGDTTLEFAADGCVLFGDDLPDAVDGASLVFGRPCHTGSIRCAAVREFVVELVCAIRAADSIDNPAPVIQVIESRRHTAEVLADPELAAVLTAPSASDHGPVPKMPLTESYNTVRPKRKSHSRR